MYSLLPVYFAAAATLLLALLSIVVPLTVHPSTATLIVLWTLTGFAALLTVLTAPPIARRIPYKIVKRNPPVPPEAIDAFVKGRRAREILLRRVKSKIREGAELQDKCERAADPADLVTHSSGPFSVSLESRVDRWTSETEKLLEGASSGLAEMFHKAARYLPVDGTDAERLESKMGFRLKMLEEVARRLEAGPPK